MNDYYLKPFPRSRIATVDIFSVAHLKHHISVLLECDVTNAREKIRQYKASGQPVSFTAWLLTAIGQSMAQCPETGAFLYRKRKLIVFTDINISVLVEKPIGDHKVPIPVVIKKTNEKSVMDISAEIRQARNQPLSADDVVLQEKPTLAERLYYRLPGVFRRLVWTYMLRHPKLAYEKMGNAVVTSLGMMGRMDGWFIHRSVHPISFGVGSVIKKPVVVDEEIAIRDMLKMTILMDHDVIDGGPMARFVKDLVAYLEAGEGL